MVAVPNFTIQDNEKNVSLTSSSPLDLQDPNWASFAGTLLGLNQITPISTIVVATGVFTLTLKDARGFTVAFTPGSPPVFSLTSGQSTYNQNEFHAIQAVANAILVLILICGMTALTVTYN